MNDKIMLMLRNRRVRRSDKAVARATNNYAAHLAFCKWVYYYQNHEHRALHRYNDLVEAGCRRVIAF